MYKLRKVRSTPQLSDISRSRSSSKLHAMALDVDSTINVVRDISFQSGISSVVCYERYSDDLEQAPELAACLETPLMEESMSINIEDEEVDLPSSPNYVRRGSRRDN